MLFEKIISGYALDIDARIATVFEMRYFEICSITTFFVVV